MELTYEEQLGYARYVISKNWTKLLPWEHNYYSGETAYKPHGIDQEIWKQAYEIEKRDK